MMSCSHDVMLYTLWLHYVSTLCGYTMSFSGKCINIGFKNLSNNLLKNPSKMFKSIFGKYIKIGFKNLSNCLLKNRLKNYRKQSVGTLVSTPCESTMWVQSVSILCEYTIWVHYDSSLCEYTMWVHYVSTLC